MAILLSFMVLIELPVIYVIGLFGVPEHTDQFDDCFGYAAPTENWVLAGRRERAQKKLAETYVPKIGDVFDACTIEACDEKLALIHAYPEDDEVEREERAKINDALKPLFEEKRALLTWIQTEEGREATANARLAQRPSAESAPVSLFVKKVKTRMKVPKKPGEHLSITNRYEYDFFKADWLPPNGTGITADVVFTFPPSAPSNASAGKDAVTVAFPGFGNGIIEMPPCYGPKPSFELAPLGGFKPERTCRNRRGKYNQDLDRRDDDRCFCIRLRTRFDRNGNVLYAFYGKLREDFNLETWQRPEDAEMNIDLEFRYYLNKTPLDRKLLWNRDNLDKSKDRESFSDWEL